MELNMRQPIGVELVKRGVVKEVDIQKALDFQKVHPEKKLGDILYEMNLVSDPRVLIEAIGEIVGIKGMIIDPKNINTHLTEHITLELSKKYKVIPVDMYSGRIKVVFSNSASKKDMETIRTHLVNKGLVMDPYISFDKEIKKIISSMEGLASEEIVGSDNSTNITSLVDNIIRTGIEKRASDIHIEPQIDKIIVRYRIDGELITAVRLPKNRQSQVIGRLKAISNMHQEKQESQDGRILTYDNYSIRASAQPNIYGEKFVLRLLKKNATIRNIFDLGFPGNEDSLKSTVDKRNSITVIAAPTGEGKTTTLYSIMDFLNRPEINITTIEDPVEIRINGLNQIEIDGVKSTFSNSLRTVMRQDPDIILVGEIRDQETGEIAIQAGQTGHYVLTTIHTIDSIETITRLRKLGLSDYDISSTLATSISQRLVRRVCPHCRKERPFNDFEKKVITNIGQKYGIEFNLTGTTYDAVGCQQCNNTGYYDRIGIFEILNVTEDIKELIMNGESSITIKRKAMEQGYTPLVIDGLHKVVQGFTTLEELNKKLVIY